MPIDLVNKNHTHLHNTEHEYSEDELVDERIESLSPFYIFDSNALGESVPEGFNALKIPIDGTLKSDLIWKAEREAAKDAINRGLKIFWEIDLGLFDRLKHPLDNQTQFLSLSLSLEHFRDTLWKDFASNTIGLCLYRGTLRIDRVLKWNERQIENLQGWLQDRFSTPIDLSNEIGLTVPSFENVNPEVLRQSANGERLLALFCRDAAGEYLDLLAKRVPDSLQCFALMDVTAPYDPVMTAQLLTKERYPKIILGVRGAKWLGGELGWDGVIGPFGYLSNGYLSEAYLESPSTAICIPLMSACRKRDVEGLDAAVAKLATSGQTFRAIPEATLTAEWDGLDRIYISSQSVSSQGTRKLQGFKAAGGIVLET